MRNLNIKVERTVYAEQVFFEGHDLCSIPTATLQYDRDSRKTAALVR